MGMNSYFIKSIGDCRIMAKPFQQAVERNRKETGKIYPIDAYDLTLLQPNVDENGEEFYTLTQFGQVINNRKFYGYLWGELPLCLFSIYEAMSIDHACCYECETRNNSSIITRRGKLQREAVMKCRNLEQFKDLLLSYSNQKSGFILRNEQISDIRIVTQRECIEFDEFPTKSRKYNTQPCRLYFSTEDLDFGYIEFLPYGKGILLAVSSPFTDRRFWVRPWENNLGFLCDANEDVFDWNIKYIELVGTNYFTINNTEH